MSKRTMKECGYSFEKALEIPKDPKAVSNMIKEYYGMEAN